MGIRQTRQPPVSLGQLHPAQLTEPACAGFCPLLVLFLGSGCAALIYEVVWLQLFNW